MENENSSAIIKETLYDKVFKPQKITLANGHSVLRRRSRTPLIVLLLALAIYLSLEMTGFDMGIIVSKFSKMLDLMKKILRPDWTFFPKVVSPLIDTIKMSILGTVIGCLLALPVAILSSSNINHNLPIVSVCRFILALIRTLPTLIIALVCALIFSLGTFSGFSRLSPWMRPIVPRNNRGTGHVVIGFSYKRLSASDNTSGDPFTVLHAGVSTVRPY